MDEPSGAALTLLMRPTTYATAVRDMLPAAQNFVRSRLLT